jgi:hypothetical protein
MSTMNLNKSIFDMSPAEIHEHLKPRAVRLKQTALDNGSWFSYRNELCVTSDMFIHEFKDGRKELIKHRNQTGEFTVLKIYY